MKGYELIYLLDDDDLTNMLNRQFINFSMPQSTVLSFEDPLDLLKNLIRKRIDSPDLMLLDIAMPELSAWEFLEYCQRYNLNFDIMILTSSLHFDDIERSKKYSQVKSYISKPLTPEHISKHMIEIKSNSVGLD